MLLLFIFVPWNGVVPKAPRLGLREQDPEGKSSRPTYLVVRYTSAVINGTGHA